MNDKIKNKTKGIMNGLQEMEEEKSKNSKEETNKYSKEEKKKRSYMLSKETIKKISFMSIEQDKNLSEIVEKAINFYYEEIKNN
jgi:hypothetical protein